MNFDTITKADLSAVADIDDVDAALRVLMDKIGITTGDIAGIVFSGFDWDRADADQRLDQLSIWLDTERRYAEEIK